MAGDGGHALLVRLGAPAARSARSKALQRGRVRAGSREPLRTLIPWRPLPHAALDARRRLHRGSHRLAQARGSGLYMYVRTRVCAHACGRPYAYACIYARVSKQLLRKLLIEPTIVKVMHGADHDVRWLERRSFIH